MFEDDDRPVTKEDLMELHETLQDPIVLMDALYEMILDMKEEFGDGADHFKMAAIILAFPYSGEPELRKEELYTVANQIIDIYNYQITSGYRPQGWVEDED